MMKNYTNIIHLLIILIYFGICIASFAQKFEPDLQLRERAQLYDRKFFPLFMKAIEELRQEESELISNYFSDYSRDSFGLKAIEPFEYYKPKLIPIYDNPLIAMEDYPVSFPILWTNIPDTDNSWNLYFQSLRWLRKYLKSDNLDDVFVAFKVIDDWIQTHSTYPMDDTPYAFNDHAVSYRSIVLAEAYNIYLALNIYEPLFEYRIKLSLLKHIFLMASLEKYVSYHNHGIIMDNSMVDVLRSLPSFSLREGLIRFAYQRMFEVYRYSFTFEGIHKEHSTCYHAQFARALNTTLIIAKELGIEIPADILMLNEDAMAFINYINYNGYFPPIGDCARARPNRLPKNNLQNEYFSVFPLSGWAFIKDSVFDIRITTQSNFYSRTHYQQHETSFILDVADNELIIDPGLFSYTRSTSYYDYSNSAIGHNVVIVDGKNFSPDISDTGLSGITRYFKDDINTYSSNGIVELTHPHYLNIGVEIHRQLAFAGNNTIIVKDIIKSDSVRNYSQQFHLASGATVTRSRRNLFVHWDQHPYYLKISGNIQDYEVIEGQINPVQGWYFPAFNQVASCPVLIVGRHGTNITITTMIEVFKDSIKEKDLKTDRREIKNLFKSLEKKERRPLIHEPFPQRWLPDR